MKRNICESVKDGVFEYFEEAYLFGSSLSHGDPSDVDILLVYSSDRIVEEAVAETDKVVDALSAIFNGCAFDVTTLSRAEFEETRFLDGEPHECIWSGP